MNGGGEVWLMFSYNLKYEKQLLRLILHSSSRWSGLEWINTGKYFLRFQSHRARDQLATSSNLVTTGWWVVAWGCWLLLGDISCNDMMLHWKPHCDFFGNEQINKSHKSYVCKHSATTHWSVKKMKTRWKPETAVCLMSTVVPRL